MTEYEDEGPLMANRCACIADMKKIFGLINLAGKDGIGTATIIGKCPSISRAQRDELLSDLVLRILASLRCGVPIPL